MFISSVRPTATNKIINERMKLKQASEFADPNSRQTIDWAMRSAHDFRFLSRNAIRMLIQGDAHTKHIAPKNFSFRWAILLKHFLQYVTATHGMSPRSLLALSASDITFVDALFFIISDLMVLLLSLDLFMGRWSRPFEIDGPSKSHHVEMISWRAAMAFNQVERRQIS